MFFLALAYNIPDIPVAAGIHYGAYGLLLNPMIAADVMCFLSISVVSYSARMKIWMLRSKEEYISGRISLILFLGFCVHYSAV